MKEAINFVDQNPNADREEYEAAREKLQSVTNPIIQKVYESTGGSADATAEPMDDL